MHRCHNRVPHTEQKPIMCEAHAIYRSHYKLERPTHCQICTEPIRAYRVRPLQCGHYFHGECLGKWVVRQDVCPMCRSPYPSVKPLCVTEAKAKRRDQSFRPPVGWEAYLEADWTETEDESDESDSELDPELENEPPSHERILHHHLLSVAPTWPDVIALPSDTEYCPPVQSIRVTPNLNSFPRWNWPTVLIPSALLTPFMQWGLRRG